MESKRGVGPKDRNSVGRPHHGSERCREGMNFGRRAQRTFDPGRIPSATSTVRVRRTALEADIFFFNHSVFAEIPAPHRVCRRCRHRAAALPCRKGHPVSRRYLVNRAPS